MSLYISITVLSYSGYTGWKINSLIFGSCQNRQRPEQEGMCVRWHIYGHSHQMFIQYVLLETCFYTVVLPQPAEPLGKGSSWDVGLFPWGHLEPHWYCSRPSPTWTRKDSTESEKRWTPKPWHCASLTEHRLKTVNDPMRLSLKWYFNASNDCFKASQVIFWDDILEKASLSWVVQTGRRLPCCRVSPCWGHIPLRWLELGDSARGLPEALSDFSCELKHLLLQGKEVNWSFLLKNGYLLKSEVYVEFRMSYGKPRGIWSPKQGHEDNWCWSEILGLAGLGSHHGGGNPDLKFKSWPVFTGCQLQVPELGHSLKSQAHLCSICLFLACQEGDVSICVV